MLCDETDLLFKFLFRMASCNTDDNTDDDTETFSKEYLNNEMYNIQYFNFGLKKFLNTIEVITKEGISTAIEKFSSDIGTCFEGRVSQEQISSGKGTASQNFDMVVNLRIDQLRNYLNATGILNVDEYILLPEDEIQATYNECVEQEVESSIKKLKEKQHLCLMMKNKLLEVEFAHEQIDVILEEMDNDIVE